MNRLLLFLLGCIGTRLLLVWLSYRFPSLLKPMGVIAIGISVGFMYIWMNDLRKTGPEVFGDAIWWNSLRPIHSLLWGLFAVLALSGSSDAWKVLLADVTLGLCAYIMHKNGLY